MKKEIIIGWFTSRKQAWGYYKKGKVKFYEFLFLLLPSPLRPERLTYYNLNIWHFDQYRLKLLKERGVVRPVIIDAGASRGSFSILAAKKFPDATIYAFEPTPYAFERLKKLTKNYPNIICLDFALGDENKLTWITDNGGEGGCNAIEGATTKWNNPNNPKFQVKMKKLDDIVSVIGDIDFLKMDTEGSEGIILKGAAETIKRCKPIMAFSAYHHPEDKEELPKIISSFAPYNFEIIQEDEEDLICTPNE